MRAELAPIAAAERTSFLNSPRTAGSLIRRANSIESWFEMCYKFVDSFGLREAWNIQFLHEHGPWYYRNSHR